MPELAIPLATMEDLIIRTRAVQGKTVEVDPDSGSNATDDNMLDALEADPDDLTETELSTEIDKLEPDQRTELVALLWTGRGDAEAEEWGATLDMAGQRNGGLSTAAYLLQEPLLAEYWIEGLRSLGFDLRMGSRA